MFPLAFKPSLPTALAIALVCILAAVLPGCSDMSGVPRPAETTLDPTSASQPTAIGRAEPTLTARSTETAAPTARWTAIALSSPSATILPSKVREQIFDDVWRTVNDNYLYDDFNGADWLALHAKYRPLIGGASSSTEFYALLGEMVGGLNDEHSRYISPEEAASEDDLESGDNSYVGIGILSSYDDDAAVVLLVFPGSPAEEAGLERRDRITHVNGLRFNPEENTIRGIDGTDVVLTIESPGNQAHELTLTRRAVQGKIYASATRLELAPDVVYLIVPSLWAGDMSDQVEELLGRELQRSEVRGIILDLRANEGGWRDILTGILGQFVQGNVGGFYRQGRDYPLTIARATHFRRLKEIHMVVLVDEATQSYAEVLAAALQDTKRAKVVGIKSAGNTETIYPYDFEDGSRLWVAQEGFRLPNGTDLEGRGVIPDLALDVEWTSYSEATDPHIVKALELLETP